MNKDKTAEELAIALTASMVLHEGVHGLLDSRPNSQFAPDLETTTGLSNKGGKASTLLDEGIAYAVQGIYAPDFEPIGSLAPKARADDDKLVGQRKKLGEKLRPLVEEYIKEERRIDPNFFHTVKSLLEDILIQQDLNEK